MVNPGGLEPLAMGLKVPRPADPGYVRSGSDREIAAAASRSGFSLNASTIRSTALNVSANRRTGSPRGRSGFSIVSSSSRCIAWRQDSAVAHGLCGRLFLSRRGMVDQHGNDPWSIGYRPIALPLSYRSMEWCVRPVSNRAPLRCRRSALPLSYGRVLPPGFEPGIVGV